MVDDQRSARRTHRQVVCRCRAVRAQLLDRHVTGPQELAGVGAYQQRRVRPLAQERLIVTTFGDQQVDEAERQGSVRAGANLEEDVRPRCRADAPRVDHEQLGAARLGRDHALGKAQEVAIGIAPPQHDAAAAGEVRHRQAINPERVSCGAGVARPLTEVGGADEVGGAEVGGQTSEPRFGFVEAGASLGPLAEHHGLGPVGSAYLPELFRDQAERLIPGDPLPAGVRVRLRSRATERIINPVGVVEELRHCVALGAHRPAVGMCRVRLEREHAVSRDCRDRWAVHRAQSAVAPDGPRLCVIARHQCSPSGTLQSSE